MFHPGLRKLSTGLVVLLFEINFPSDTLGPGLSTVLPTHPCVSFPASLLSKKKKVCHRRYLHAIIFPAHCQSITVRPSYVTGLRSITHFVKDLSRVFFQMASALHLQEIYDAAIESRSLPILIDFWTTFLKSTLPSEDNYSFTYHHEEQQNREFVEIMGSTKILMTGIITGNPTNTALWRAFLDAQGAWSLGMPRTLITFFVADAGLKMYRPNEQGEPCVWKEYGDPVRDYDAIRTVFQSVLKEHASHLD